MTSTLIRGCDLGYHECEMVWQRGARVLCLHPEPFAILKGSWRPVTQEDSRRGILVPIGGAEEKFRDPTVLRRFVEICGHDGARIAILPTASRLRETGPRYEELFLDLGAKSARSIPISSREDCQNEEWLQILEDANGVFMTGGNQLRLSTTLGGTAVSELLRRRHAEGLHIAGTSAGAAFLSEHMIAFGDEGSTPRSNMVTLAPGLGLTPRIIIDQHFRQRDRLGRLLTALSYNPFVLGIGLDEDTAAIIHPDETLEACGSGGLTIIDARDVEYSSMDSSQRDDPVSVVGVKLHILIDGGTYDMQARVARPAGAATGKA